VTPGSYAHFFDVYAAALPVPLGLNVINLALLASVLVVTFNRVPAVLVRSFVLTGAAIAPLWLLFGYQDELRVFTPVFAPWTVLLSGWLRVLGQRPTSGDVPDTPAEKAMPAPEVRAEV
jgi:hypothetical protein